MTTTPYALTEIFASNDDVHGACCTCCDHVCDLLESQTGERPANMLWRVTFGGVQYVTDRYAAVRADLFDPAAAATVESLDVKDPGWKIPDAEPGPSTQVFSPARAMHLIDAGLDIRDNPDSDEQHLYRDGEHVGWFMPLKVADTAAAVGVTRHESMTLAQVDDLRTIAAVDIYATGSRWDTAATILNEVCGGTLGGAR